MNLTRVDGYQNVNHLQLQPLAEVLTTNSEHVCEINDIESENKKDPSIALPNWTSLKTFEAETTLWDKVSRIVNIFIFVASLYGAYALITRQTGLLAYASYLSLGLAARKVVSTIIGYLVYPAAFSSLYQHRRDYIKAEGDDQIQRLEGRGCIVRKISLYKSGTTYNAVLIAPSQSIENGKWTINALGNGMAMEPYISRLVEENFDNESNTLLVNGPSVGSNNGWPTRYQMGAGFEAGIQLLEREVEATHIIMRGLSLGGGMMGEAILNHDFTEGMKKNIRYLSITDRSFSRLSAIAAAFVAQIVKLIFYITGTELDGVGAARKLSQLGIQQIVIQHKSKDGTGGDGVIPNNVSTAYELHADQTLTNKIFLESKSVSHNGPLPDKIKNKLNDHIKDFLENT